MITCYRHSIPLQECGICQLEYYFGPECPRHGHANPCLECYYERRIGDVAVERFVARRWAKRWKAKARQQRAGENDLHELEAARAVVEAARLISPCGAQRTGEAGCPKCEIHAALAAYDAAKTS